MKTKGIYREFSQVYDVFMSDTPYDEWVLFVERLWEKYSVAPKLVLELACGSGNITQRLKDRGYSMIGIDSSEDMLALAAQKAFENSADILYLLQDMRDFELYGTVDSVICLCDGMNYILNENDLDKIFALVENYLNPGGLFIFDMNTEYKFKYILNNNSFCETTADAAYIWENEYNDSKKINEYHMNFFIKTCSTLYKRFEEVHFQKVYDVDTVKIRLESAGLEVLGVFDDRENDPPGGESQRIYYVARKK